MSELAAYREVANEHANNNSILKYVPLVKKIAYHLKSRMPDNVQINDLLQSGMVGLIEASKNFKADKGACFETFASNRIRGSMLDGLRKNNWLPRSVYQNARRITEAITAIEKETNSAATPKDIAKKLGISLNEYHHMLKDIGGLELLSIEESPKDIVDDQSSLQNTVEHHDLKQHLSHEIEKLPHKEKMVLALYYYEELNFREVGEVLDISESRVSQLHNQAILKIKQRMKRS